MMDRVLQILGNNTAVGQLSGRQPDIIKMYYRLSLLLAAFDADWKPNEQITNNGQVVTHRNDVVYHRPIIKNLITGTVSV